VLLSPEMRALCLGSRGAEAIEGNRLRARGMALFTVVVHNRAQAVTQCFQAREDVGLLAFADERGAEAIEGNRLRAVCQLRVGFGLAFTQAWKFSSPRDMKKLNQLR
jgi:hypothetical protein